MAYALGALHAVNASSTIVVADPAGLKIRVRQVPATVSTRLGPPLQYFDLGQLALGNADGYQWRTPLRYANQLEYPVPRGMTSLALELAPGAAVDVTELTEPAVSSFPPLDRYVSLVNVGGQGDFVGPTNETTLYSWSVPAGLDFWCTGLWVAVRRLYLPNTRGPTFASLTINGARAAFVIMPVAPGDFESRADVVQGGMRYPTGTSFAFSAYDGDAGGWIRTTYGMQGWTYTR